MVKEKNILIGNKWITSKKTLVAFVKREKKLLKAAKKRKVDDRLYKYLRAKLNSYYAAKNALMLNMYDKRLLGEFKHLINETISLISKYDIKVELKNKKIEAVIKNLVKEVYHEKKNN